MNQRSLHGRSTIGRKTLHTEMLFEYSCWVSNLSASQSPPPLPLPLPTAGRRPQVQCLEHTLAELDVMACYNYYITPKKPDCTDNIYTRCCSARLFTSCQYLKVRILNLIVSILNLIASRPSITTPLSLLLSFAVSAL